MLKLANELPYDIFEKRFGGEGEVKSTRLLEAEQMKGKGRAFNLMMLTPGSSLGYHQHNGETETYYILSGEGMLNDNGEQKPLKPGDVAFTDNGGFHSIENTGTTNLEFVALILFA